MFAYASISTRSPLSLQIFLKNEKTFKLQKNKSFEIKPGGLGNIWVKGHNLQSTTKLAARINILLFWVRGEKGNQPYKREDLIGLLPQQRGAGAAKFQAVPLARVFCLWDTKRHLSHLEHNLLTQSQNSERLTVLKVIKYIQIFYRNRLILCVHSSQLPLPLT